MRRILACLAICAGCRGGASIPEGRSDDNVSGTYSFVACDGAPCEPGTPHAWAEGTVVLANEEMPFSEAPAAVLANLGTLGHMPSGNGCFEVRRLRQSGRSWLGLSDGDSTVWDRTEGRVRFSMFRGVFQGKLARYVVTARISGGTLLGAGTSEWESHVIGLQDRDYLVGRRLGPPDPRPCFEGMEREIRKREEARRAFERKK